VGGHCAQLLQAPITEPVSATFCLDNTVQYSTVLYCVVLAWLAGIPPRCAQLLQTPAKHLWSAPLFLLPYSSGNPTFIFLCVCISQVGKIAYSAHEYGPYVASQDWFYAPDFPSNLNAVFSAKWGLVAERDSGRCGWGSLGASTRPPGRIGTTGAGGVYDAHCVHEEGMHNIVL